MSQYCICGCGLKTSSKARMLTSGWKWQKFCNMMTSLQTTTNSFLNSCGTNHLLGGADQRLLHLQGVVTWTRLNMSQIKTKIKIEYFSGQDRILQILTTGSRDKLYYHISLIYIFCLHNTLSSYFFYGRLNCYFLELL